MSVPSLVGDTSVPGWPDWPYSDLEPIADVRVGAVVEATLRRLAELGEALNEGADPFEVEAEYRRLMWTEAALVAAARREAS